ncbi:hypothetical protein CKAH01_01498 [Colletotrichum kahawae]|uniref:Uncharacterized protein n=1 Tax=Colletotrichum kahawae TaxID=34407 RepID=A0AAE0D2N4_COLKA|nr:hypothetical protein CKAH01_01498 [Colletotrichum kahawae]
MQAQNLFLAGQTSGSVRGTPPGAVTTGTAGKCYHACCIAARSPIMEHNLGAALQKFGQCLGKWYPYSVKCRGPKAVSWEPSSPIRPPSGIGRSTPARHSRALPSHLPCRLHWPAFLSGSGGVFSVVAGTSFPYRRGSPAPRPGATALALFSKDALKVKELDLLPCMGLSMEPSSATNHEPRCRGANLRAGLPRIAPFFRVSVPQVETRENDDSGCSPPLFGPVRQGTPRGVGWLTSMILPSTVPRSATHLQSPEDTCRVIRVPYPHPHCPVRARPLTPGTRPPPGRVPIPSHLRERSRALAPEEDGLGARNEKELPDTA